MAAAVSGVAVAGVAVAGNWWRVRWSGVLTFAAISEVLGVRVGGRAGVGWMSRTWIIKPG